MDTTTQTQETQQTQQTQTPAPVDFRAFVGEDGSLKPGWGKAFEAPEGFEKKFSSIKPLIGSFAALERLQFNGNKVTIPGEHATDAEWSAFYEKLGRPAGEDKYEVAVPEDIKDLPTLSAEGLKEFKQTAFKAGLTQKQVNDLTGYYFKVTKASIEQANAASAQRHAATVAELEKEWGPKDGTKWKENLATAERGAAALGLTAEILKSTPELSNNPHFIRAMAKVANMTKESQTVNPRQNAGDPVGDIDAQIKAVMSSPAYNQKGHPDHKAAVASLEALFRRKHPDAQA